MIINDPVKAGIYYQNRRDKLHEKIEDENLDALLVTHLTNVRYLSGFSGTAATMLVSSMGDYFLTDFRYTTQANEQVTGVSIVEYKDRLNSIKKLLASGSIKKLGVEMEHLSVAQAKEMEEAFSDVKLVNVGGLVESIRIIKDAPEIEAMKALVKMLENVYPTAKKLIGPGVVERDVAIELEYLLRKEGGSGPAFDFIVGSGVRSALPHGVASDKKIASGEMVILDWGVAGWGYHSDNTRTFAVGEVDDEMIKIFDIVLSANKAAFEFTRPGVTMKQIDEVARNIIKEAGYGDAFGHGTGHGVGLDIHEKPAANMKDETVAQAGMVFTIEPGIYLPGKGGVRIEDMALITKTGVENISQNLPKEFISI